MKPPLAREEWDFEHIGAKFWNTPKGESGISPALYQCFAYEFARSLPKVIRAFRAARRQDTDKVRGAWTCTLAPSSMPLDEIDPTVAPFLLERTWDRTLINEVYYRTESDSSEVSPGESNYFPQIAPLTIVAPLGFPRTPYANLAHHSDGQAISEILDRESIVSVKQQGALFQGPDGRAYPQDGIELIYVNWRDSDDVLIRSFRSWLARSRKVAATSNQGKSFRRQLEANLKALGIWRLLRAFDGNISKASAYCEQSARKVPFTRSEDWNIACARAKRILEDFAHREIVG